MFVSASTPFDPLLPANGSALRAGILTSFLVLLISTLIMWITSSLQVKTRKKKLGKSRIFQEIEIGGTKIPGNRCAMTSSRQKRGADDITQRHWINKVIYVCRTIQPKPSQKKPEWSTKYSPDMKKKIVAKEKNSGNWCAKSSSMMIWREKTSENLTTADALFCIKRAVH